eukprot:10878972-Alexandrium_andersonii.AAC.1
MDAHNNNNNPTQERPRAAAPTGTSDGRTFGSSHPGPAGWSDSDKALFARTPLWCCKNGQALGPET